MNLIFHLSRDYLTQRTVEQYMELAAAYGVERLALVCNCTEAAIETGKAIRNIRPAVAFKMCAEITSALNFCGGTPVLLSPYASTNIQNHHWAPDPTIVVGDDRGDILEPDLPSVFIRTPGHGLLWSQQAAAIGLHECHLNQKPA